MIEEPSSPGSTSGDSERPAGSTQKSAVTVGQVPLGGHPHEKGFQLALCLAIAIDQPVPEVVVRETGGGIAPELPYREELTVDLIEGAESHEIQLPALLASVPAGGEAVTGQPCVSRAMTRLGVALTVSAHGAEPIRPPRSRSTDGSEARSRACQVSLFGSHRRRRMTDSRYPDATITPAVTWGGFGSREARFSRTKSAALSVDSSASA